MSIVPPFEVLCAPNIFFLFTLEELGVVHNVFFFACGSRSLRGICPCSGVDSCTISPLWMAPVRLGSKAWRCAIVLCF